MVYARFPSRLHSRCIHCPPFWPAILVQFVGVARFSFRPAVRKPILGLALGAIPTPGLTPDRDNLSLAQAGIYAVQGTDANGCQNSATTNLVVNICPELCTNGIDDDGDGLIDFDDPDCPCND